MQVPPEEIAAGREYIEALRQTQAPADKVAIIAGLMRVHYLTMPAKDASPDENKLRVAALAEELQAWPADAVQSVLMEWPRTCCFFPTLAELVERLRDATYSVRSELRQAAEILDGWEKGACS